MHSPQRDQIIIALSGKKQSGKNTAADFISQYYYKRFCKVTSFVQLWLDGRLMQCSFADGIKKFCIDILGLTYEQCYGSDDDKNSVTAYKWENISEHMRWEIGRQEVIFEDGEVGRPGIPYEEIIHHKELFRIGHKYGSMTAREVMQLFGTELIRKHFGNVWAKAALRRIRKSGKKVAVITDNRFPSEAELVLKEPKGHIIRLMRSPFNNDTHESETALDGFDWNKDKCFVLDNRNMNIQEQNNATKPILDRIFGG